MKKALSLLLVLVMCLSLCACGGGNDAPETTEATNTPTSTQNIPNEGDTPSTGETIIEDKTTAPTENIAISHPLVQEICCEWYVGSAGSEDAPFQSLVINEDGTCVVDGVDATWRIEEYYTKDTSLSIYIYVNGEACYGILYLSNTEAATLTKPSAYCPIFQPYEAYKK